MFGFKPARSSSPAKSTILSQQRLQASIAPEDVSRSSAFSAVPELAGLSTEEVGLIDAIIERAGPAATTFLTVFKAYNDIFLERGLDPHETIYYEKLLKLGTLKGTSWRDKWDAIKDQNGYGSGLKTVAVLPAARNIPNKQPVSSRIVVTSRPGPSTILSDDLFSSGIRDSQISDSEDGTIPDHYPYPASSTVFPSRKSPSPSDLTNNSLGLKLDVHAPRSSSIPVSSTAPFRRAIRPLEHDTSEPLTSTPPSYRVVARGVPTRFNATTISDMLSMKSEHLPLKPPSAIFKSAEGRSSVINEEDAWKKVAMMHDEREADRFRKQRLVERCFDVWRQGFQWIMTTNEQIDDARDNLLLRRLFQRCHQRTTSRLNMYERVDAFANRRLQRTFFSIWKARLKKRVKEKQQTEWRRDMRMKIQLVRARRDLRIVKEAWVQWGRSHKLIVADQFFYEQLVVRLSQRWRTRLQEIRENEAVADGLSRSHMWRVVESYWDHWRASTQMSHIEKVLSERVGQRIISEVLDTWNKKTYDVRNADAFYHLNIAKKFIRSWKTTRDRIRNLEFRADKHVNRQDDVLLRAVMRVWKAHERGKLLEKVKAFRLAKTTWAVWNVQPPDFFVPDLALHFCTRLNSSSAKTALSSWRRLLTSHQNTHSLAVRYHCNCVVRHALLQWRLQLHAILKLAKKARIAEKFLVLHKSWNHVKEKYHEQVLTRKFQAYEKSKVKKIFDAWLILSHKSRQQRLTEELFCEQVRRRILSNSLTHWTNRVIEIKVRELEVSQRNEAALIISAFKKWTGVRARHLEELGLMQSYQDIKRHENVLRIFTKWLTATRTARHRRDILRQKEEEIKLRTIETAWDRWRERFQEERLRPLSLPAIHFDSKRVKIRYWKTWINTMPRALQAKTARETDKKAVLKKILGKWLQVYRTKLSLKAVARARYFPAPAAPALSYRTFMPPLSYAPRNNATRKNFPRRVSGSISPEEEAIVPKTDTLPVPRFTGLGNRLKAPTKARTEVSPTRTLISEISRTRASSPARSTKSSVPAPWYMRDRSPVRSPAPPSSLGGPEERNSLWQELQDVRRKSQTPSEKSRPSRKPP
ncbi:hypothetical protein J3R30DRAFT_3695788 [Lentinula aciculospora]|uniref:Sfi1 spindle body domain-containing protein n=1 Tax=Lentinula aciculospora TaxID=153920 RepID=A0A9W9AQD5_9AGAR|nr:hypothetical protein J3R30DRAFT_3695788 [Lentinula aciculospora]